MRPVPETNPATDPAMDGEAGFARLGAHPALLHAIDCGEPSRLASGARVKIRWREPREGGIRDIACFELEADRG